MCTGVTCSSLHHFYINFIRTCLVICIWFFFSFVVYNLVPRSTFYIRFDNSKAVKLRRIVRFQGVLSLLLFDKHIVPDTKAVCRGLLKVWVRAGRPSMRESSVYKSNHHNHISVFNILIQFPFYSAIMHVVSKAGPGGLFYKKKTRGNTREVIAGPIDIDLYHFSILILIIHVLRY